MATPPPSKDRRLKVYWAEIDGLNDWVVAAPNRPQALQALGVHQDLFAQGEAGDADDPAALKAARAAPLTPLRRPKGSGQPFVPATGTTDWSAAVPKTALRPGPASPKTSSAEAAPARPEPDRRPLERARARLAEVEERHQQAQRRLAEDRARLEERQAREAADHAQESAEAKRALTQAERAWRQAGGRQSALRKSSLGKSGTPATSRRSRR